MSNTGTIKGSILGPILYAIFVCPLFNLHNISNYADDNFVVRWNRCINALVTDMQTSLEAIIKSDKSIFSYGYIGMDISEMMTLEVSEISEIRYIQISKISRPNCPFLALDILEMDISEMTLSNGIGIQICPFPICPFPICPLLKTCILVD